MSCRIIKTGLIVAKNHRLPPFTRLIWLGLAVFIGVLIGYGAQLEFRPPKTVVREVRPSVTVSTLDYPLSIPAQRQRSYPGGVITTEQELGEQGGYRLTRISYPSDGLKIYGLMATPSSERPVFGYPVVILVHGYINPVVYRTNGPEYSDYIAALARAGYVVIKPDLRGHDRSWGVASGAYYDSGYASDILNLAGSIERYPVVDGSRIGLFGHSMGGYISLQAASIQPKRFRAASLVAPAAGDLSDMYYKWRARSELDNPVALASRKRLLDLFGEPSKNPSFWTGISPLGHLDGLETAIQTHHGLADTVVPPRFSEELQTALAAQKHPGEAFTYPGIGHTPAGAARGQIINRTLDLYTRYLRR